MTSEAPSKPGRAARAAAFWALVLFVGFLLHGPLLVQRPRPLSRTELALVSAAERALREGDEGFDYAAFFLKQEGAAGTPLEERWRSLAAAVDDASHPYGGPRLEAAISSILLVLFRDAHLARYRREQAGLSGFLVDQQAGGNCEAQTKLLVASLRASRVALPEGTELGVEVFQDHAQAVLVSRRDRRLWNLLSGEQETAPRGDVYRPAILLSAYLRGLGLEVPISDAKLLLLRGPRLASTGPGATAPAPSFFTTSIAPNCATKLC